MCFEPGLDLMVGRKRDFASKNSHQFLYLGNWSHCVKSNVIDWFHEHFLYLRFCEPKTADCSNLNHMFEYYFIQGKIRRFAESSLDDHLRKDRQIEAAELCFRRSFFCLDRLEGPSILSVVLKWKPLLHEWYSL